MIKEILWPFSIFCWQDIAEILIIFFTILYISYWFKKDKEKPLVLYLYSYLFIFFITDFFQMETINFILLILSPIALSILILMHKETLQKNFIALHTINGNHQINHVDWPEILIQATLFASNKNISLMCIIENNDSLVGFTKKTIHSLEAPISKDLLEALTTSTFYNQDNFITINQNGKIISINDSWEKSSIDSWLSKEIKEKDQWIQDGIFFTTKTDAFIYRHNPSSRNYTIIHKGKLKINITTELVLQEIRQYINAPIIPNKPKGTVYGSHRQKSSFEQSLS